MNSILLSLAKRNTNLDTCYIECPSLHLHQCIRYILLLLKYHSFEKFSCIFQFTDERSICKLFKMMIFKPHKNLNFLSIVGNGSERASQSIWQLNRFLSLHENLQYLNLCYFQGIEMHDGQSGMRIMRNNEWTIFCHKSLLELKELQILTLGTLLMDDNEIISDLCDFISYATSLISIDLSINPQSYERMGGALENTKKLIFFAYKNQKYLQAQVEECEGCLEVEWKIPLNIVSLITEFAFNLNGQLNINMRGMPAGHMFDVNRQFMKLKKIHSKKWRFNRDLQLFTHL